MSSETTAVDPTACPGFEDCAEAASCPFCDADACLEHDSNVTHCQVFGTVHADCHEERCLARECAGPL